MEPPCDIPFKYIVAEESPFRLRDYTADEFLSDSLRRFGLLSPLWLQKRPEGNYNLAHGSRRHAAMKQLGFFRATAYVFEEDVSPAEILRQVVSDNSSARALPLMERVRAWAALKNFNVSNEVLIKKDQPLLGFPPSETAAGQLNKLADMDGTLLQHLSEKDCPFRRLPPFLALDADAQGWLGRMAAELKPSLNELETLADHWSEAARREGLPPMALLNDLKIKSQTSHESTVESTNVLMRILESFRARRYPELSRHQQEASTQAGKLHPPAGVNVQWDPSFEKPGLRLQVEFRSARDIPALSKWLAGESQQSLLKGLLKKLE